MSNSKIKAGLDVETSGNQYHSKLASIQVYLPDGTEEFLPFCMKSLPDGVAEQSAARFTELNKIYGWVGHNMMFDAMQLTKTFPDEEILVMGDTMYLTSYLQLKYQKLKDIVIHLKLASPSEVQKLRDLVDDYDFTSVHYQNQDAIRYACNDARWAYLLEEQLLPKCERYMKIYQFDLSMIKTFLAMTVRGIGFDFQAFSEFREQFQKDLNDELAYVAKESKVPGFRPNSYADCATALWAMRDLPKPSKRTKTGYSTAIDALEEMAKKCDDDFLHDLIRIKSDFSVNSSMKKMENYLEEGAVPTLHPRYLPVGHDSTGRVYTTNPSSNSLPAPVRKFMKPIDSNNIYLYYDIDQAELMLFAALAKQQDLLDAYAAGVDIHRYVYAKMFGKAIELVTDKEREAAKTINFSILFGSEGGAASRKLGTTYNEGHKLVQMFWGTFRQMHELKERLENYASKTSYCVTPMGRYRRLAVYGDNRDGAMRQALNTPIQSGLSDYIKLHISRVNEHLNQLFGGYLITSVFDSVLLEVPRSVDKAKIESFIKGHLQFPIGGSQFQFRCTFKYGENYYQVSKEK